jgi:uncharacterized protein (DUF1501 family)
MIADRFTRQHCCDDYEEYRKKQQWLRQSRRDFLKTTVGAMAAAPLMPHILLNSALASRTAASTDTPILVVIQLQGGNDGLNTIVPYASDLYFKDRPTIGVPAKSVLPIDNTVGFNPNLKNLKTLYDQGKVAILQGVGYPNPTRSHFQGTSIWETADPTLQQTTGWLGRYLDAEFGGADNPLQAVALGPMMPQTLFTQQAPVTSIENINTYRFLVERANARPILSAYQAMVGANESADSTHLNLIRAAGRDAEQGVADLQQVSTKYTPTVKYPTNPLATELQLVAQMISANLGTRIFHVTVGGFDDHVAEVMTHARLLQYFGDSVAAFYQDMTNQGKADQVLIMTFSEFGRRVKENAGRGTDHGTAAPLFVVGGKVKGGLYGQDPILSTLDDNGDLIFNIDFRAVYGTVIDGWLGGNSSRVLGGSFERLPFI